MKRIQEKVKDVVEVRPFTNLQDFISDPVETLAAYHFTDATSDMMAKWLDKAADVTIENGAAIALAGYRGVGKSHFLATFGAIVANPELRNRVIDQHVSVSAQRLKRRHYPVAFVRRGTHETLIDELKDALGRALEIDASNLSNSLNDLLQIAAEKAGDLPFLIIVDTALERASRVARDDGQVLGEIAHLAKDLNIFVGVALDDDISGADGVNAAIAQNYTIDFLDQEHLYKIVDTHIFPKNRSMQPLIHDIYAYFREVLPNFRWSEQRFAALYPLHPVILENAPFVRLFVPDFALLGFASEAGGKILGRPANSLIALDEVFDSVENSLRKIEALAEAFQTYDRLNAEVVGQISVMQRLQAKLILKGFLLLSLDGNGTTAGEISAAMLIYDENAPNNAIKTVDELLEKFSSVLPDAISRTTGDGREIRYSLKASNKNNLNNILAEAAKDVSPDVIPKILRRFARDRFSDWILADEIEQSGDWADSQVVWRGGMRRGRLFWNFENRPVEAEFAPAHSEYLDWEVIINSAETGGENTGVPKVFWKPAPIRKDEAETILRYYVLLTDSSLKEEYGEQIHAAGHAHTIAVERIWNRMFIDEANLVIENFDYNFTEEARAAQTLSDLFSIMLEPLFEMRYPQHPIFGQTLGMTEVSTLVNDLFSGARANLPEIQTLAETFALPLGLVALHGTGYILEKEEHLVGLPLAREVLALVDESDDETISLREVYRKLKQSPTGLVREAQHLILTALVAQRKIEFVTSKGDRINRRSLDLKIIWDDIEGIAKPSSAVYGNARLADWARILTGIDNLRSIDTPEDCAEVAKTLEIWFGDWQRARILERFNELPDELLNTKIWRIATHAGKTFGVVAATVGAILEETVSLDEGLHRVADAFSDSEKEFFARTKDLVVLEDFINSIKKREQFLAYVAISETTDDEKIEYFREKLLQIFDASYANPNEAYNREIENLWQTFHTRFSEHFVVKHDLVMKSHHLQEKFDEILRSDEWWEFENLSRFSVFPAARWKEAQNICRQLRDLDCRFDVREMLKTHPFCVCSFSLQQIREWEKLPQKLLGTINQGRKVYRNVLRMLGETLAPHVRQFAALDETEEFREPATHLIELLHDGEEIPLLTNEELMILQKVFEKNTFAPVSEDVLIQIQALPL
ncbi:MAG TPA: DUF6079 family protein [Pyrinomonadaceae bacterium]|jgi:hypothetical protein